MEKSTKRVLKQALGVEEVQEKYRRRAEAQ